MRWVALGMVLVATAGCASITCTDEARIYSIALWLPAEGVPPGLEMVIVQPEYGTFRYTAADLVTDGDWVLTEPVCIHDPASPGPPLIRCRVAGFPPGNAFVARAPGYRTVVLFPQWATSEDQCHMDVWGNEATLVAE